MLIVVVLETAWLLKACEWLHLSFTCSVCKLEYSKTLFFSLRHSHFRCPFCRRGYVIEKKGQKCIFKGDPLEQTSLPIIRPFEVEWHKPITRLRPP
jgi:transposase-like protein